MYKKQHLTNLEGRCLCDLVSHFALKTPHSTALIFQDQSITYADLEEQSSLLAAYLQQIGVHRGNFVAIHLARSIDLIIGIIGIQKAGAAYVPIDIDYPVERIAFMLSDSKTKVVLSQNNFLQNITDKNISVINFDTDWAKIKKCKGKKYSPVSLATDLAYMIYTSGSTGKPKGVMISHKNVFNQLEGQQAIAPDRIYRMLLTCSISFDVSVLTIYWTLYQGATLVIPEQGEEKDIQRLSRTIEKYKISHILTLPSLHTLILEQSNPEKLQSLKLINVSGEVCPVSLAKKHEALLPNCQLYNLYGPTEATVNCTFFKIPTGFSEAKVPIGIPIKNYEIFILNKNLKEVSKNETGEIYIGGSKEVVGKGYWNRLELTKERFIKNPFSKRGGSVLYKTGDLARWMLDGNIEFLGRADFQVKFRGYRIELGEIETAIGHYSSIKEVVVLLKNGEDINNQRLIAYVTLQKVAQLNISKIRGFLNEQLPEYMIPTAFVVLDKMPLTPNGKFDRKALPDPPDERPLLSQPYQAPKGKLEEEIAQIWETLLYIRPIGRKDKFFELGGNSIQAAQFIGQLQKRLNTSIFITTIFDNPTIEKYAKMLEKAYVEELEKYFGKRNPNLTKSVQTDNAYSEEKGIASFRKYLPTLSQKDTSKEKNLSAIFILAPPRSGTSLLSLMLAGHPNLLAFNELNLLGFHTLREWATAFSSKYSLWQEGAIRAVMELKSCHADDAKLLIRDFEKKDITTKTFYKQLQDWASPKTIVDKTPAYAMDLATLQKAEQDFENPIFIHLIRHPYSMVNSFEKYHLDQVLYLKEHPYTARELGELVWIHSHQNILAFLKNIPQNRQCQIRYEDLVQFPEKGIRTLCQQTGLSFHPDMLRPYKDFSAKNIDGIYKDSRSMSDSNLLKYKKINAAKAEEWKKITKNNFLSKTSMDLAERLGYERPRALEIHKKDTNTENSDIAIIGIACRLPGANNLHEFWTNLVNGVDVSKEVRAEDLIKGGLDPNILNDPSYVARALTLDDVDSFDASFFGYHPKTAAMMDPQHRVLLEVAYAALENAGYNPFDYTGKIGAFGGVARNAYFTDNIATHPDLLHSAGDYQDTLGSEKTFSISRIAYKLNLKGPAVNVQTACSTSGTAVHLACQSILNGDSDMVLVGGGRIQPALRFGYQHIEGGPLSPDGYIRTFDAEAKGMAQGNGVVCIVLKKLDKALTDKDHIWAVIKGTAINNDGADKIGFTAPSVKGQAKAIIKALATAKLKATDIDYIEAHGTGTVLGDPIEVEGLTKAFRAMTDKKQFCGIGSVKTAIGHLDAGSCLAGIIKVALALKYELLPPSLNFEKPNPQIDFVNSPFYVSARLKKWEKGEKVRRAGVSSFGLGGTNAHIILEEAPQKTQVEETGINPKDTPELLLLSAKSEAILKKQAENLVALLERKPAISLTNVAYTLAIGRATYKERGAIVYSPNKVKHSFGKLITHKATLNNPPIIFMFPGGGAQYVTMAKGLYEKYSYFRKQVDYCLDFLEKEENLQLRPLLFPSKSADFALIKKEIEQPAKALATLFIVEYALAKLWQFWGIQPSEMIGHSMGEYTAACLAGVFSVEDGLRLVTLRGRLFESLPAEGGMLSVPLSEEEVGSILTENTVISVVNKLDNCVVSGQVAAIDLLQKKLAEKNVDAAKIHINVAAHSPQIDPIIPKFRTFLQTINFKEPAIPIISNVSGKWAAPKEMARPEYWINHLRKTVRFSDGLATIFEREDKILLEVGPGQTLATFARQHPEKTNNHFIFSSIRHPKEAVNDVTFLLKTIGKMWGKGLVFNWENYYKEFSPQREPLPTYPFERKPYWIEPLRTVQAKSSSEGSELEETSPLFASVEQPIGPSPNNQEVNKNTVISRKEHLIFLIKEILFELSGLEPEQMDNDATFLELGFDSLFLTQAITQFNRKFKLAITFRQLFEEASTIETLAEYMDTVLEEGLFMPEQIAKQQTSPQLNVPVSNISLSNTGNLQQIINQQLQIMQQQIDLLKSGGQLAPSPQLPSQLVIQKPENTKRTSLPKKSEPGNKKGFGPWKPIPKGMAALSDFQKEQLNDFIKKYNKKTAGSKKLSQEQRFHLSDPRSIQAFDKLWKDAIYQIAMERSKGSKMWDIDGNEYIDFLMSFGIGIFGHTPDFVQEAVREQMDKGTELAALPPLAKEVASLICEITGMERTTLVNTGSEAVSAAIRAARTVTGKEKIAIFEGDYHGIADEMLVRGIQLKGRTKPMTIAPGIPASAVENVLVLYYDDPNLVEVIEDNADELAAVIIEPIHTQTPHLQRKEVLEKVRAITEERDIPLIFDELVTGFRLTQKGARGWYSIEADICAYGKIASGGLPIAMVAGKAKYLDAFDGGYWQYGDESFPEAMITFFGGTFVKHPVSLAAAKATLEKIKESGPQLQLNLNEKGKNFAKKLKQLFLKTKAPLAVKSAASIIAVKVIDNYPLSKLFFHMMRYKGVYMTERAGFISAAHSEADLDKVLTIYEAAIAEMFERQFFQIWEGDDLNEIVDPALLGLAVNENEIKEVPLTDGQEEIWINHQFSREAAAAYNLATEIRLEGIFDLDKMRAAIQKLIDRHEALRTTFGRNGKTQIIAPSRNVKIPFVNLEVESLSLEEIYQNEAEEAMDLFDGPLSRFQIIRLEKEVHLVIITVHHIIADGWSLGILTTDLGELYAKETGAKHQRLSKSKQLSTYALESVKAKDSPIFLETQAYWVSQFKDKIPVLEFPTDRPRPFVKTYPSALEKIHFSSEVQQQIRKVAAKQGVTFYTFMFAAFQTFIYRLAGQKTFTLGLVAAGQAIAGNKDLVAHSVRLLPLKMDINQNISFSEHLKKVRAAILDAFDHQNYTLGALVKQLKLPRDSSRQPIISILFNLDNEFSQLNFGDLKVSTKAVPRNYETFDIFINLKPTSDGIFFEWIYNTDLFDKKTIQNRLREFEILLNGIIENPTQPLTKLPLLPRTEQQQILVDWNQTDADYPLNICIHTLFEQQAKKTPQKIALAFEDQQLTYQELNKKASHLAGFLQQKGLKRGDKIGIYLERSAEMLISLLAVLKLGGIYVPLDPINPEERLRVILEDVAATFLLTHQPLKNRSLEFEGTVIFYEETTHSIFRPVIEKASMPVAKDLAYIIYTSGSTGKPKGIAIPHYAVVDHHFAIIDKFEINQKDKILAVASITFDPSVQDFFMPLFIGASVIIASRETVRDGFLLKNLLEKTRPTLMQATPSTWKMLLLAGWQGNPALTILSGGESLSKELSSQLIARSKAVWNIYGPTETTIWSTTKKAVGNLGAEETGYEPVGRPINNVKVYILDKNLQLLPIGVPGEIFIAGIGLAPYGYFNRPDLTAQSFLPNPFAQSDSDKMLYRTGDIGKYLPNGDIEYLNRKDKQVKIRGFRIELGDVEFAIASFESVRENIVLVREDQSGSPQLVAYLIMEKGRQLAEKQLVAFLKKQLPSYMIPMAFVEMDAFPLTTSMKVDRKRLPIPNHTKKISKETFFSPETATEKMLASLWSELLNIEEISVEDDFFELGGHSLIAVSMMTKIEKNIGTKVPLAALLQHSTVRGLAKLLDEVATIEFKGSLVPIKPSGQKPPIYLIHGGGLHVLMFQALATYMDIEQPIYALQARGLNGEAPPLNRIEDIAAHYISEIQQLDPQGPYALAGYSFGGLIAFEMAKQLKILGKKVSMLGAFDTVVKPKLTTTNASLTVKVSNFGKKVAWNLKGMMNDPKGNLNYKKFVYLRRFNYWKSKLFQNGKNGLIENSTLESMINKTNFEAWNNYKITPYDGDLYLFRAQDRRFYIEDFEFFGWKPFILGKINILDVPGDHLNLFNPPNGEVFAKILQQLLDETERGV